MTSHNNPAVRSRGLLGSRSPSKSPVKVAAAAATGKKRERPEKDMDEDAKASLRRRMAGPSSAKAGLALDQDEINRIIYEASKGSKFFENEKKKDAQVTEQVNRMLAKRDEKLCQVPPGSARWLQIEREMESYVAQLETTRDLSRHICVADLDMFYASVELKRDPSLKGKEFAVGSGVLVTASYEARRFGCRSGQATHIALALCPHLIVVKNDMPAYVAASRQVMDVLLKYDENLAQASLDEAYMDLTGYVAQHQCTIEQAVERLREEIREKTGGLTASVGIAPNKMIAKISSDRNKPNGQFRVPPSRQEIVGFMRDLPVRKVPGIGRVTERILQSLGVKTCGDIWTNRVMLHLTFDGKIQWLLQANLGLGSNIVEPSKRTERKSVGRETTFRPTRDTEEMLQHLREACDQVEEDLKRLEFDGRTVTLVAKHDTYQRFSRAYTFPTAVRYYSTSEQLFSIAKAQFETEIKETGPLCLRLIGVRLTNIRDLRELKDGGRLGKMFKAATGSRKASGGGSAPTQTQTSLDDATQLDKTLFGIDDAPHDEEEAEQIRKALELSLNEVRQGNSQRRAQATDDEEGDGNRRGENRHDPIEVSDEQSVDVSGDQAIDISADTSEATPSDAMQQQCPVCQQLVKFTVISTEAERNARLNQHIDSCLSGVNDLQ